MKRSVSLFFFFFAFFILNSCSTFQKKNSGASSPDNTQNLTRELAKQRSEQIKNVHYYLDIRLNATDLTYAGKVEIDFDLLNQNHPIILDFFKGQIRSISANEKPLANFTYNEAKILIPAKELKSGPNILKIEFDHSYSSTGAGLHRFQDPQDNGVYLYTQFEPYDANRFFPCFDQPDLKATYTLTVEAPADWQIVSSTLEKDIRKKGSMKLWSFPKSQVFSTYLFSLHAGPYQVWKSQFGKLPLRLLARKSMAKYIRHQEWFSITKNGLAFYNEYFQYPYPFKKYDQIIVPDFNAGAMENVAAVTFAEKLIPRATPTYNERERIAAIALHEMAHMWFGDLVTMQWWDGLWLNESFATYMATLSLDRTTEFKNAWQSFFAYNKQRAYIEDAQVTTHPVDVAVPDIRTTSTNFDGITYGKGASVLKQLSFFVGADTFRDGVRRYLKKREFQNATITDFMDSIAEGTKLDLKRWTHEWLKEAGTNSSALKYSCEGGQIKSATLEQKSPEDHPLLRQHRTRIGLFKQNLQIASVDTLYDGTSTEITELRGKPCPEWVYANLDDYDFAQVRLDEASLQAVKTQLPKIKDPLLRVMLWQSLWFMVRDVELSVSEYIDQLTGVLGQEKEIRVLTYVLETLQNARNYLPPPGRPGDSIAQQYETKIENFLWTNLNQSPVGSELQRIWFDAYVHAANTPEAGKHLMEFLNHKRSIPKLVIDQDRRWEIITRLNRMGAPGSFELIAKESKQDPSDQGVKMSISAQAVRPDEKIKAEWFAKIEENKMPLAKLRHAIFYLFPKTQVDLHEQYENKILNRLTEYSSTRDTEYLWAFTALIPATCSEKSVRTLGQYISQHSDLSPITIKSLRIAHEEDERCVKIRKLFLAQPKH